VKEINEVDLNDLELIHVIRNSGNSTHNLNKLNELIKDDRLAGMALKLSVRLENGFEIGKGYIFGQINGTDRGILSAQIHCCNISESIKKMGFGKLLVMEGLEHEIMLRARKACAKTLRISVDIKYCTTDAEGFWAKLGYRKASILMLREFKYEVDEKTLEKFWKQTN